jgi:CBS domain containing-hemolysin-like protein
MLIEVPVAASVILVAALLLMSTLDFALDGVNKIALRRITEATTIRSKALCESLVETPSEVLMVIHITIQTLLIALAVLLSGLTLGLEWHWAVALPTAAGTTLVLVLIFRQLLPRAIALRDPEGVLTRLLPVISVPYLLVAPVVHVITSILKRFEHWEAAEAEEEEEASEEEIRAFIDVGQEEGILEQDEGDMIQSVVEFGDKRALEVMTPRTQIVAADVSWTIDRAVSLVVARRHSRIPVYRDELDNIEGVVHERDLLAAMQSGERTASLRPLLHPAHFVPETKPIDDLLEETKGHAQQLVLVVDEYGGVSGLITIEDLVEEIVGEIDDDPQSVAETLRDEGTGRYFVPGGMELDAMESRLGVDIFPTTEATTVGGAVVELFGRLPSPGERIRHHGFVIEVIEADRRRIRSIRIRTMAPRAGAS